MAAQVTEADQIKQFKEFLGTYNKLTENCFMDCVKEFTTREVKPEESTCSESCLQKYLKMTQRIPGVPHPSERSPGTESRFNGTTVENYRPLNMDITPAVPHPV